MIGGLETHVMTLAQGLAGHATGGDLEITLVTPTPVGNWDDKVLPFRVVRRPGFLPLLRLLRRADVIHLAGPTFLPMLFGLLLRKPVVVEHDVYQAACPNGLLLDERSRTVCPGHYMARHYLECVHCNAGNVGVWKSLTMLLLTFPRRLMCGRVARNVYPSNHIGQRLKLLRGVNIYHGTPDPHVPSQRRLKNGSEQACFAFVGRLDPIKGVSLLLRAAEILASQGREFRLKIIGDGPERAVLEALTDRCGLRTRTTFTGALRGDALRDALSGSTASVMPSVCEDIAPLAAIEHMIHGRVLVASDIGGLGELVGEAGLKFPPGDIEGLASCLRRVVDEPNLANVLGEKARQRALQLFREERMVAEHLALYRDLAEPRSRSQVPARVA